MQATVTKKIYTEDGTMKTQLRAYVEIPEGVDDVLKYVKDNEDRLVWVDIGWKQIK